MSEKQYKVSVASPFHNTNLDFFRKCMDSLRAQSIGFKNIQWVITVHNSEKEYVDAVKEIAEQHSNIEVYELYNDYRTASSPRNECLKHIRSKYVFSLIPMIFFSRKPLKSYIRQWRRMMLRSAPAVRNLSKVQKGSDMWISSDSGSC